MFRFDWPARTLLLLATMVAMIGLLGACGSDDGPTPPPGAELPGDFPLASVPLIDGRVLSADGADGTWSVIMQGPAGAGDQLKAAVDNLTEAGYSTANTVEQGGTRAVTLSAEKDGTTYTVTVGTTPSAAAGSSSVLYQVSAD